MTVKFNRLGTRTSLVLSDPTAGSLPNGDWALGAVVVFDGTTSGTGEPQWVMCTDPATTSSNNMTLLWGQLDAGITAGRFYLNYDASTATRGVNGGDPIEPGKAYLVVVQRSANALTTKICPVLKFNPADGASVITGTGSTSVSSITKALPSAGLMTIGDRTSLSRRFDHSMCRAFRIDQALTDHQIAQLAYGKEITAFGRPVWYLPMNTPDDAVDVGTQGNTVTKNGPLATGTDPGFGFVSVPTAPVIQAAPVIIGGVQTGVASSYAQGEVVGNPIPTITQQWQISTNGSTWSDIAGATGATYTPQAADGGKQLRVRQTATNSQGTASLASASAVISTVAVGFGINELTAERIYQRVSGTAPVAISGTFSGEAPTSIEYQLYAPDGVTIVKPWVAIAPTIGANTWTATPAMPEPGNGLKYRIQARAKNAAGVVTVTTAVKTNRFGVGDVIVVIGSSSAAGWFGSGSGANIVPDNNSTSELNDPHDPAHNWGLFSHYGRASSMAAYIAQSTGVPVALASLALGGSNLSQWADTSSLGGRIVRAIENIGGKIGGMFSTAGSNDITSASAAPSVQAHLDKMLATAAIARTASGQPNLGILWSGINRRTNANDGPANNARMAEVAFGGTDYPNNYHVQSLDFELSEDGTHLTGAGYRGCCERIQFVWAEGRKGIKMRGPEINKIAVNGTEVVVSVTHWGANNITPATGGTGFTAYDLAGNPLTISNSRRLSGNQIGFTTSSVAATVRYLEGQGPEVGTPYYNDAPFPLPMLTSIYQPVVAGTAPVPVAVSADFSRVWAIQGSTGPVTSQVFVDFVRTWVVLAQGPAVSQVSRDFARSWAILAEPPTPGQQNASQVSERRKVVFPGGTRVVAFGGPVSAYPGGPYQVSGRWTIDKHPLDEFYCVADISFDLTESVSTAASVIAITGGVTLLEAPVVQGALVPVKIGGLDEVPGALNFCTLRITLANGEQLDRTIWFAKSQGVWRVDKDPDDRRYFVADVTHILADSNTEIAAALKAMPVGVTVIEEPVAQGSLLMVKLGGMDVSADPLNHCTLPFLCANGEKFFRAIHFNRVDN